MPVNRFSKLAKSSIRDTFVPQAIPLPFEFLQSAINTRQEQFDEAEGMFDQLGMVDFGSIEADKDARVEIIQDINKQLDTFIEESGQDFSRVGGKVKGLARSIVKRQTTGDIKDITDTLAQQQAYFGQIDKAVEKGTSKGGISAERGEKLKAASSLLTPSIRETEKIGSNRLATFPISSEISNVGNRMQELIKDLASNQTSGFSLDKNNNLIVQGETKFIRHDRAFKVALDAGFSDKEILSSVRQGVNLNNILSPDQQAAIAQEIKNNIASIISNPKNSKLKRGESSEMDVYRDLWEDINSGEESDQELIEDFQLIQGATQVANEIAFTEESNIVKSAGGGNDNFGDPFGVQLSTQSIKNPGLNSPTDFDSVNVVGDKIKLNTSKAADQFKMNMELAAATTATGIASATMKAVGTFGHFFVGLINRDELESTDPNYISVEENLKGSFEAQEDNWESLSPDRKRKLIAKEISERLEMNVSSSFTLSTDSKGIKETNFILFGNPDINSSEGGISPQGAISNFQFVDPDTGKSITGFEFKEIVENNDSPISSLGTIDSIDSPFEWGSSVINVNGQNWIMSPTESDKQTGEYFRNRVLATRFSSTFRNVFTAIDPIDNKSKQFEVLYQSWLDTDNEEEKYLIKRLN